MFKVSFFQQFFLNMASSFLATLSSQAKLTPVQAEAVALVSVLIADAVAGKLTKVTPPVAKA